MVESSCHVEKRVGLAARYCLPKDLAFLRTAPIVFFEQDHEGLDRSLVKDSYLAVLLRYDSHGSMLIGGAAVRTRSLLGAAE